MIKIQYGSSFTEPLKVIQFPGGERHVSILAGATHSFTSITVEAQLTKPEDIIDLLMAKNALDAAYPDNDKLLLIRYLPYARQDRIAVPGEAHELLVMCDLIRYMNFDDIIVWDVHSDVPKALLPLGKTRFVEQHDLVWDTLCQLGMRDKYDYLISPDAGAEKKVYGSAKTLLKPVIHAYKKRDPKTGKLSEPRILLTDDINDKRVLIVDDICDGGFTFVQLGQVIKANWPKAKIDLYVTHGIFSKGVEPFAGIIDNILCPNVLNDNVKPLFTNNLCTLEKKEEK